MFNSLVRVAICVFAFSVVKSSGADDVWTIQNSPAGLRGNLYSVFFTDKNVGWAVGDSGMALYTKDGGSIWQQKNLGVKKNLYSVSFATARHGYISQGDTLFETKDSGNTWVACTLKSPTKALHSVQFIDSLNGFAGGINPTKETYAGNSSVLMQTVDGGKTWTRNPLGWTGVGCPTLVDVSCHTFCFSSATSGWAWGLDYESCGASYFQRTVLIWNSEGTWKEAFNDMYSLGNARKAGISAANATLGWAVIQRSSITDSAYLFNLPFSPPATPKRLPPKFLLSLKATSPVWCVKGVSAQKGWIVGDSGKIIYTSSMGATWTSQPSGTSKSLNAIYFPDTSNGWIVGDSGTILHLARSQSSICHRTIARSRTLNSTAIERFDFYTLDGRRIRQSPRWDNAGLKNGAYIIFTQRNRKSFTAIVNK